MEEYALSIGLTRFVSSRGTLHRCNLHCEEPLSSARALPDISWLAGDARDAPVSVYVCSDALPAFNRAIEDLKCRPFVLVTGDSDWTVGGADNLLDCQEILQHSSLVSWYAQNCALTDTKVHHLPIGLDYHTAWSSPALLGTGPLLPLHQEQVLLSILRDSKPIRQRKPVMYCDWRFNLERGDRAAAFESIPSESAVYARQRLTRLTTWRYATEHAFVASPIGAGYDCHRTWEALMLGCIPVVSRSPIAPVFEELPVLIVDDWADATPARLKTVLYEFSEQSFDWSKLFARHWTSRIEGETPWRLPRMTIDQFKAFLDCA